MWKRMVISPNSPFFTPFMQIVRQVKMGQEVVKKTIINRVRSKQARQEVRETYRFDFDWQDEDICGVEVYKEIADE